jgi:plastocyanin
VSQSSTLPDGPDTAAGLQASSVVRLLFPFGIALAVTAAVYLATQVISPNINTNLFGQTAADTFALKSWLANGVLALAALQLYSALWIYGRLPWRKPRLLGLAHRVSGYAAIALSLPIGYHCLFAYGFRDFDRRTLVHSIAGCFFYGALAAKLIIVRSRRLPGWALPVAGGTMVTLVFVLWYSSALWYFNNFNSPGLSQGANGVRATYPGYPTIAAGPAGTRASPLHGVVAVSYVDISIRPAHITIRAGSTVKWTNFDATLHNVAITGGPVKVSSPALKKGDTYVHTFTTPGLYRYLCTFHPGLMNGTITVVR